MAALAGISSGVAVFSGCRPVRAGVGLRGRKAANPKRLQVFRQGLTELGDAEGKNIRIDCREAVLDGEYCGVMGELVGRKVDIVLAANIVMGAAKTTSTIPVVCKKSQDGSHRHYLKS